MEINKNYSEHNYLSRGKQSIKVTYKGTDEVSLSVGYIHLKSDGTEGLYAITTGFDFDVGSPTASTWGYIMCAIPSSGSTITVSDISYSETEPTLDEDKKGYYSADGTKRCIGFVRTDGSSNILTYVINNHLYNWSTNYNVVSGKSESTWTQFNWTYVPLDDLAVSGRYIAIYSNADKFWAYSWDGISTWGTFSYVTANDTYMQDTFANFPTNGKVGYYKWTGATTNTGTISISGFTIPYEIYNP